MGISIWLRSYTGGSRMPYTSWLHRCVCPERSWHTVPAGQGTAPNSACTSRQPLPPMCENAEGGPKRAGTGLPASRGRPAGKASLQAVSRPWVIAGPATCCQHPDTPQLGTPGLTPVTRQAIGCCGWPPATMQEQAHGRPGSTPFTWQVHHKDRLTPVILCKLGVVLHLAADALSPVHHVLDAGACT